jgi:hypothetical protein
MNMVKWFRKKPVKVQAVQFLGSDEVFEFCPKAREDRDEKGNTCVVIPTPEGEIKLNKYDWLLLAPNGSFYKSEPDIMEEFYEEL